MKQRVQKTTFNKIPLTYYLIIRNDNFEDPPMRIRCYLRFWDQSLIYLRVRSDCANSNCTLELLVTPRAETIDTQILYRVPLSSTLFPRKHRRILLGFQSYLKAVDPQQNNGFQITLQQPADTVQAVFFFWVLNEIWCQERFLYSLKIYTTW